MIERAFVQYAISVCMPFGDTGHGMYWPYLCVHTWDGSYQSEAEASIPPPYTMIETLVKIMVELLAVLALAMKQINQGSLSTSCSIFLVAIDGLTRCREVCKETTGRERHRISSSVSRSAHPRGVQDDCCPDARCSIWSGQ